MELVVFACFVHVVLRRILTRSLGHHWRVQGFSFPEGSHEGHQWHGALHGVTVPRSAVVLQAQRSEVHTCARVCALAAPLCLGGRACFEAAPST